jgi:HEAT repeat protein
MTLADLLAGYANTPQLFDVDEELTKKLAAYKNEIADLFVNAADARTKLVTAGALARIDPSQAVLPVLMNGLEGDDDTLLAFAALCLGLLGSISRPAVPALIRLLTHDDPMVVCEAARTLGRIGSPESVPPLVELLGKVETVPPICAIDAAIALGTMGAVAQEAIPALHRCVDGKDKDLRLAAARAIWCISGDATEALAVATELLDDDLLCLNACQLLANLGEAARPAAERLQDLLHHHDEWVRQGAAEALVRCWFR